jgi:hypothetical protein
MKRQLFMLSTCFILASHGGIAQDSLRMLNKNAVLFELGGNGLMFSLSYERMFYQKNDIRLCGRIGPGIFPSNLFNKFRTDILFFPFVEANLLVGRSTEFFETGLGFTYDGLSYNYHYHPGDGSHHDYQYHRNLFFYRLGYRYQGERGFMFRAAATPIFFFEPVLTDGKVEKNGKLKFYTWLGVTFGYSF